LQFLLRSQKDLSAQSIPPQTFNVAASISSTLGFIGQIAIGTPPQPLTVLFDGGAFNLQVTSTACVGCNSPTTLSSYNLANSTTSSPTSTPFSISYGTGTDDTPSQTGITAYDQVAFYTTTGALSPAVNASIGVINSGAQLATVSGDLGLGRNCNPSFVTLLFNQGYIPQNMFALAMNPSASSQFITFGGYDPTVFGTNSPIYWQNVFVTALPDKAWNQQLTSVNNYAAASGTNMHFDFGAGKYEFPWYYATSQFYNTLGPNCSGGAPTPSGGNPATYVSCICGTIATMNPLVINLGNLSFLIPATAYVTKVSSAGVCSTKIEFCVSTVTPRLSANWQQYFYIIHDYAQTRMGFAGYSGVSLVSPATGTPLQLSSYTVPTYTN